MNRTSILDDETFRVAIKRLTIQHQVILTSECGSLSSLIRAVVTRSRNLGELDLTISAWLRRHLGEVSETAKKAAIAAMAIEMGVAWQDCDAAVQDLLAESRRRLAQSLRREEGLENVCRDAAVASGAALWVGAFFVVIPERAKFQDFPVRARRAAMGFYRRLRISGITRAMMWLWETKLAPWAEVHLETRDLQEFSRGGYLSSYRRMAACLKERPYLAGAFSASWLNDPQLALISPHLGFVERTGYESGAELIKLRTEAEQIAFAAARSPRRRKLIENGQYDPRCFGLYWTRRALVEWSSIPR